MKGARRFPLRLVRWTGLCALSLASCVVILSQFSAEFPGHVGARATGDAIEARALEANVALMPEGNGYTYSRSITIDHTKVPNSDQSNFPLLINGTYSYLATVANGGRVQNSNGYDIIFTSDSACATKLNHEVETYNATTGAVNYWVKVPTVSHTSDTSIYMCYGNSSITTDQSNKTAVWDNNFVSVYHLPNGSTLNTNDSTSTANQGTNSGATATTGQIDGGGSFDGSSKAINVNHPSVFNFGNGDYTLEAWIKATDNSVGANLLSKDASGARQFCLQMATNGGAGSLNFIHFNGDGTLYWRAGQNSSIATGSWSHVVAVRSGSSLILYVNATSQTLSDPYSNGPVGTMASTATDALIGRRAYSGFENYFNGSIDEVRISNIARSADWLKTECNNQSSPSTFYAISAASGNQSPVANAGGTYTGVTGTAVSFNGSSSSDPDGTIASYSWNFGDSNSGSGATPTHTYATAGTYTVTLTVTDNLGATNSASTTASITGTLDARLDPLNRTGGEDPLSRNFNWSIPLVGLPGRAGLDLGLSLAYNSLATWTRNGSSISFDDDRGTPSPGFRLGFPVIQGTFYNSQAGKNSFIMITPSGGRVELRQVGTSTLYQSVDSSYLLLDATTMTLKTMAGTQLSYVWKNGEYECALIKDRNGNYLTVNYDTSDRIDTVVDTLSRTITFNYDSNGLSSITQTWAGQTHYWARFTYANKTIQTNFTGLTVNGPQNNSTIHALTSVKLADDSHFDFDYTSWGQVWKISQYTGETSAHLLNYRSYNLPVDNSAAQTDCPRFTVRHDWAENWNRDTNGTAQEVNTTFAAPVDAALPDNSLAIVTKTQVTSPDGTYQQIYFAGNISGGAGSAPAWERGLPLLTDTFDSSNTKQRSATTAWTQDDENIAYQLNPRVTETNITDPAGNHARTSNDYAASTLSDGTTINLPQNTYEYQADATTQLRRTHVAYNLDSAYTSRRIIGLVSEQTLYGGPVGSETLMSKVSYQYDGEGSIQGTDAPVKHDNTNYTATFRVGRGNVSSVKRYDLSSTAYTTSTMQYNTAGAVVETRDPLNHGVSISYADSFSDDGNSRNALAYPTTVTNYPAGFSSSMKYNFDFGAATRKQTPLPNVTDNEAGPVQTIEYDSLGRLQKVKNLFNNAYTRYEYPASQNRVDTYVTIVDTSTEAHSFKITDGHGRVISSASDHPGSTGGFSGQLIYYDTMGRVIKQSNPTETSATSSSGNPYDWPTAGDDAQAGWIYTQQSYDWKGRPLVTTNTDSTTKSASYGGCGCAGGQVVTLTDEVGRQQKVYADVLGREWKTEVLNSNTSVYSTIEITFNARDQVTQVRQFQGLDTSGVYQETTMAYDGYGRLHTKHAPEQSSNTATTWDYNNDDTINSVTDARGATNTFSYNSRRLVTGVAYSAPTGITAATSLSFSYDAAGNRTAMGDASGSTSYSYDQLSRLTSESHALTGLPSSYIFAYEYNLGGELTKITDQTGGTSTSYIFDTVGRLTGATGTGYGNVSQFSANAKYRASGALSHEEYGDSTEVNLSFNTRMMQTHYALDGVKNLGGDSLPQGSDFLYYNDGSLKFVSDFHSDTLDNGIQDRAYTYDHAGRIGTAVSGTEARDLRDGTNSNVADGPFKQVYTHDAWNNMVGRTGRFWSQDDHVTASVDSHDRNSAWSYDADGNLLTMNDPSPNGFTPFQSPQHVYDAAGNHAGVTQVFSQPAPTSGFNTTTTSRSQTYDGNGQEVKRVESTQVNNYQPATKTTYYVRSSVLGQVIAQLDGQGAPQSSFVFVRGAALAIKSRGEDGSSLLRWEHPNPVTGDVIDTGAASIFMGATHLDPQGVDVGESDPFPNGTDQLFFPSEDAGGKIAPIGFGGGRSRCVLDGLETECGFVRAEASAACPDNSCGPRAVVYQGRQTFAYFQAYADGYQGFVPLGATYIGHGNFAHDVSGGAPGLSRKTTKIRDTDFAALNGAVDEAQLAYGETQDDPPSLASHIDNVCSLLVEFRGLGFGQQNGSGISNRRGTPRVYGLGFTVSGTVVDGTIGHVEEPGLNFSAHNVTVNPAGAWTIQQLVSYSVDAAYDSWWPFRLAGHASTPSHAGGPDEKYRRIEGNNFVYADFPGPRVRGSDGNALNYYRGEWDFGIKLMNGSQACEVDFHISMSLENGVWQAHVRPR